MTLSKHCWEVREDGCPRWGSGRRSLGDAVPEGLGMGSSKLKGLQRRG